MTKWIIFAALLILILFVAVTEMLEEEWYKGYMDGMAEHEKMMRKEKENGEKREKESA